MAKTSKGPKIPYALDANGELVHVDKVPNGDNCGCVCIECGKPMCAANEGKKNTHYFRHQGEGKEECFKAKEYVYHKMAIEILEEEKCIMAPSYKNFIPSGKMHFVTMKAEVRDAYKHRRPDVIGVTEDGTRICIEIFYSHKVEPDKLQEIVEEGVNCLEVDIRKQEMNRESLRKFLLESIEYRQWLNHPEYEKIYQEEEEKKRKQREEKQKAYQKLKSIAALATPKNYKSEEDIEDLARLSKVVPRPTVKELKEGPIKSYYDNIKSHDYFPLYREGTTVVVDKFLSYDKETIIVLHADSPWGRSRIPFHVSTIKIRDGQLDYKHIGIYSTEYEARGIIVSLKK